MWKKIIRPIDYFLQHLTYHQCKDNLAHGDYLADLQVLAEDAGTIKSIQHKLFKIDAHAINVYLIKNPKLLPELFLKLFIVYHKWIPQNFKYTNSKTQALYEKMRLLV